MSSTCRSARSGKLRHTPPAPIFLGSLRAGHGGARRILGRDAAFSRLHDVSRLHLDVQWHLRPIVARVAVCQARQEMAQGGSADASVVRPARHTACSLPFDHVLLAVEAQDAQRQLSSLFWYGLAAYLMIEYLMIHWDTFLVWLSSNWYRHWSESAAFS